MTSERRKDADIRRADGRYVRWSWRYKTFQCMMDGHWRNITPENARAWAAAGLPLGVHGGDIFNELEKERAKYNQPSWQTRRDANREAHDTQA